jgi:DNA repair exonuclease SbcCD ATPase subunit
MAQVPSEIADRLYAAHPDTFVAERDKAVAAAREAGDRELATAIGKLRKPTVAAWLVNLLALRRPDLVADLAELAGQLRAAQRDLRGDELRELSAQRRAVVSALVEQARAVAVAEQPELVRTKLPLADVESTLSAALADEEVAAQVRSGRLVRTIAYTGFGEVPRPKLRLVTDGAGPTEVSQAPRPARDEQAEQADARRRAAAEQALAQARAEQREADAELERAIKAEEDSGRELAEVEAELAELQRRRTAAEEELSRRKLARKAAERAVSAARRRVGDAQAAVEALTGE